MINSAYTLTSFIKRLLLLSFIALFATQVYADITISQAAPVASAVVPVSVEEIVLRFNASDTSEETNNKVDTITLISAKAGDGTFGFDTAVNIAMDCIDRLHTTAESHNRVMVVELMGRHAGWITTYAGLAGGADVILIPEKPIDLDQRFTRFNDPRQLD